MQDPRQLGPELRRIREAAGLRREELAARTGLSLGTIAKLELGTRWASAQVLARILRALDVRLVLLPGATPQREAAPVR